LGIIKKWNKKEIFEICEDLIKTNYNEEKTIAIQWIGNLRGLWASKDFLIFEKWLTKHLHNWGKVDDFCLSIISHFIIKFPKFKNKVKFWAKSNNQWKRRASAVSFIQGGSWKIYGKYLKDIFGVATILLKDKEDLVQKGCGWMLKIASESNQKEVFDFVMKHKKQMARTTLRYAIEKMPSNLKKKAMKK
jgi:3-methyladenine DNA glycosylase AlkD